jgi:Uma2 family endonuclease
MSVELPPAVPLPAVTLIEKDGIPLESLWHHLQISLLIDVLSYHWRDRDDFFVGGNMFIYYSEQQARHRDYRGPDFFVVNGVMRYPPRRYWAVWMEDGRYPDMILELLSPSTAKIDRTVKKELYEQTFRTGEYYCFDPETSSLEGWRLGPRQRYRPIKINKQGRMWSEELNLWLGTWHGTYLGVTATWLRFFDLDGNLLPMVAEAEQTKREAAEAELARLKARLEELGSKE